MYTIGAFAIIQNEKGEVLLCHRRDMDIWNQPGGRVEVGESPWAAVIREVKEETGLDVKIEKFLGVFSKPDKPDIIFSFLCKKVSGELTLNDEADIIKYFDYESIPENTLKKQVLRISRYLENPDKIALIEQYDDGRETDSEKYFI
ncbi:MAG: NUDIX domain-containing protein [Caldisericia bacterium]